MRTINRNIRIALAAAALVALAGCEHLTVQDKPTEPPGKGPGVGRVIDCAEGGCAAINVNRSASEDAQVVVSEGSCLYTVYAGGRAYQFQLPDDHPACQDL